MEDVDILVANASELLTLKGVDHPRVKEEMLDLGVIPNGSIAIKNGRIIDIGVNLKYKSEKVIDATGKTVMPGFVDPHTHLVFAGTREFELKWKLDGLSYHEIKEKGGGITYTVDKTRKASFDELYQQAKKRLDNMLRYGTTTCEAKTGYGLNPESEAKILKVQKMLNETHPVDIISTFLGAHAIPYDYDTNTYMSLLLDVMIPEASNDARFCDVFCEKGFFNIEQSREILETGKRYGLIPKIHADELSNLGGAALAAEIGAISADHLLMVSEENIKKMTSKGVIGVMLPGTPFSMMLDRYAPARTLIDNGVPLALATDLNPNCYCENMQFIIQLACLNMHMTPEEAICAATYNAACAIKEEKNVGSLEIGKKADIIILDASSYKFLSYHFGVNLVDIVIKNGGIVKF
ncbi:MAG: imidazolonepropionase [Thermoplasmata archaeon]|nr:MAG: imidazolonepropionase [Thermoplasmata archaeon]